MPPGCGTGLTTKRRRSKKKAKSFFVEENTKKYVGMASYADLSSPAPDNLDKTDKGFEKTKHITKQSKERGNAGSESDANRDLETENSSKPKTKRRK